MGIGKASASAEALFFTGKPSLSHLLVTGFIFWKLGGKLFSCLLAALQLKTNSNQKTSQRFSPAIKADLYNSPSVGFQQVLHKGSLFYFSLNHDL